MTDPYKLLLVDDEPAIVKMVGKRLEAEGYEVSIAMDGEEALRKADAVPDLIILDVMLPKMNGFDVCRRLKAEGRLSRIPVILFTALTQQKDKRLGFDCGADAYISKPFRTQELLEKISELIAKTSSRKG